MAAVRHMGFVGEVIRPPMKAQWPIDTWWQTHVKISSWLAYEWWQCLNFLSFRLESPIHGPIISVFWGLTPKFREHHLQPKRRIFAQNYAFWTVFGPDRTCRVVALCVYIRPFPIGENFGKIGGSKLPYDTPQENATSPLDLPLVLNSQLNVYLPITENIRTIVQH